MTTRGRRTFNDPEGAGPSLKHHAYPAADRVERNRQVSFTIKTNTGEQLVAVDKGYIDGREIVRTEDGRMFENTATAGLVEYGAEPPLSMAVETPETGPSTQSVPTPDA